MKTSLFAAVAIIGMVLSGGVWASEFCDGYKVGYEAGRCYRRLICLKIVSPVCPLPRIGERTFQDGYQRGFLKGVEKAGRR